VYSDRTHCGDANACPPGRTCVEGLCVTPGPVDAGTPDVALVNPLTITLSKTGAGRGSVAVAGRPDTMCGPDCTSLDVKVSSGVAIYIEVTLDPGSSSWAGRTRAAASSASRGAAW
jgi:hypothetical protein